MGLAETLGARAARKGRSAPVECGELGVLTVEALPVRELELLLRQADGQRAVFYAACRELQSAGEELRKAGKVFTPDGIMQFVSDSEAAKAAEVILALSGETKAEDRKTKRGQAETEADSIDTEREQVRTKADAASTKREFRLAPAQLEEDQKALETDAPPGEKRPVPTHQAEPAAETVRDSGGKTKRERTGTKSKTEGEQAGTKADTASTKREQKRTFRLAPVQKTRAAVPGFGQVSRETMPEIAEVDTVPKPGKKTQAIGISPSGRTQNVVTGRNPVPAGGASGGAPETALHEIKSEIRDETREPVHESTSEFQGKTPEPMHETESEWMAPAQETVHETESEFDEMRRGMVHETTSDLRRLEQGPQRETKSESGDALHEMKSEFREGLHETESEFPEKGRAALHEASSELAEDVARRLVEGLRRAKWVRGD